MSNFETSPSSDRRYHRAGKKLVELAKKSTDAMLLGSARRRQERTEKLLGIVDRLFIEKPPTARFTGDPKIGLEMLNFRKEDFGLQITRLLGRRELTSVSKISNPTLIRSVPFVSDDKYALHILSYIPDENGSLRVIKEGRSVNGRNESGIIPNDESLYYRLVTQFPGSDVGVDPELGLNRASSQATIQEVSNILDTIEMVARKD